MRFLLAGPVKSLAFSPDGRWLRARYGVWSLPSGEERPSLSSHLFLLFMPGGLGVTLSERTSLFKIDLESGAQVDPHVPLPDDGRASTLLAATDHSRVGVVTGWGQPVRRLLWFAWPSLQLVAEQQLPERSGGVIAAPSGLVMLDHTDFVQLIEPDSGHLLWWSPVRGDRRHQGLAVSPCGRRIASAAYTRLTVLDAADGRPVHELRQRLHFLGAAFTPDGRFLATVSNERTVKFFDTSSWALRHELAWEVGGLRAVAFSADGMLAAAGGSGRRVVVWDLDL